MGEQKTEEVTAAVDETTTTSTCCASCRLKRRFSEYNSTARPATASAYSSSTPKSVMYTRVRLSFLVVFFHTRRRRVFRSRPFLLTRPSRTSCARACRPSTSRCWCNATATTRSSSIVSEAKSRRSTSCGTAKPTPFHLPSRLSSMSTWRCESSFVTR